MLLPFRRAAGAARRLAAAAVPAARRCTAADGQTAVLAAAFCNFQIVEMLPYSINLMNVFK